MEGETPAEEQILSKEETPAHINPPEQPQTKAFKIERKREKRKRRLFKKLAGRWPSATRIDALSLLAAILGLMSLGMPWIFDGSIGSSGVYHTLWYYLVHALNLDVLVFGLAASGMLLGSLLAIFSRIGGVVQLAGLVSFVTISTSSEGSYAFGAYVGAVACAFGIASMILRRTFPLPARLLTIARSAEEGKVSINVLSMVGGALGVLSCFLVWYHSETTGFIGGPVWTGNYTLIQLGGPIYSTPSTIVAALCLVAGSMLSILTPLGSIGQFVGISAFLYSMREYAAASSVYNPGYGSYLWSPHSESSYGIGFYLGLASVVMITVSMLVRRRLELSAVRASQVFPWIATQQVVGVNTTPRAEGAAPWRGLVSALAESIKTLFIVIVVLVLAIAAAGVAYALPWSDLEISIYNIDEDSRVHFALYIDGEGKVVDYVSSSTYYAKTFDVRAGTLRVALDYGFPDDEHHSDVDGFVDWSTSVKIKPLRTSLLNVGLGALFSDAPIIEFNVTDHDNGWKLSVISVKNHNTLSQDSLSWSDMLIVLDDGSSSTSWETTSILLGNGTYSEQAFSSRLVGDISVNCTVVDLAGNGYMNIGDFIVITSGSNYTFSSDVTYTLYVLHQPTSTLACEVTLQGRY